MELQRVPDVIRDEDGTWRAIQDIPVIITCEGTGTTQEAALADLEKSRADFDEWQDAVNALAAQTADHRKSTRTDRVT